MNVPLGVLDDLSGFKFTTQIYIDHKPEFYAFQMKALSFSLRDFMQELGRRVKYGSTCEVAEKSVEYEKEQKRKGLRARVPPEEMRTNAKSSYKWALQLRATKKKTLREAFVKHAVRRETTTFDRKEKAAQALAERGLCGGCE